MSRPDGDGPRPARRTASGTSLVSSRDVRLRLMTVSLPLVLMLAACDSRTLGVGDDASASADGAVDAMVACPGQAPQDCINGCATGHVVSARLCDRGAWICPVSTVPVATCTGSGDCPANDGGTCTDGATGVIYYKQCSSGSWRCPPGTHPVISPDGGAPAVCMGNPPSCALGTPGGLCGDATWSALCTNGAWTCAPGQIPFSQCRCSGPTPPGCVCGDAGLVCPSDAGAD